MNDNNRKKVFERNKSLEGLLTELNTLLQPVQEKVNSTESNLPFPLILVTGPPRSGTTLMLQWLANTKQFSYPSNFTSRFFKAPYIGALVQQLLFSPDFDFKGELLNGQFQNIDYKSDIGKTVGPLAPHEFWYFWLRFFTFEEVPLNHQQFLEKANFKQFKQEIATYQNAFNLPFAIKGMIANWHLSLLSQNIDNILFVNCHRSPIANIDSLLRARVRFYGTENEWYSFKPREYNQLKNLSPAEQVAGQVYYTNKAINEEFELIPSSKKITVNYADFCKNPKNLFDQVSNKLKGMGYEITDQYSGTESFTQTENSQLQGDRLKSIESAYQSIVSSDNNKTS